MDTSRFTRDDVRQILRASEGIRSQIRLARVVRGRVSPAPVAHTISKHLHSAGTAAGHALQRSRRRSTTTKFLSMQDMVEAFWLMLQTPEAAAQVASLQNGGREDVSASIPSVFGVECEAWDPQGRGTVHRVRFTSHELRRAGRGLTACFTSLECRERAGRPHLQVHTFYPVLSEAEVSTILNAVRADTERR